MNWIQHLQRLKIGHNVSFPIIISLKSKFSLSYFQLFQCSTKAFQGKVLVRKKYIAVYMALDI